MQLEEMVLKPEQMQLRELNELAVPVVLRL